MRRRIKAERNKRDWKQQQLADRMLEHGHTTWTWTTVAKLEGGSRRLQLGEAAALCDIFGISLEMLSGRRARPVGDLTYAKGALLDTLSTVQRGMVELVNVVDTKARELAAADPEQTTAALLNDVLKLSAQAMGVHDTAQRMEREHRQ